MSSFVYGICFGEESVAKVEDKIVQEIKTFGVKDRFLIKEFKPEVEYHKGFTSSPLPCRITMTTVNSSNIRFKEEFPEDKFFPSVMATKSKESGQYVMEFNKRSEWGENSIHRFAGRVVLQGNYISLFRK